MLLSVLPSVPSCMRHRDEAEQWYQTHLTASLAGNITSQNTMVPTQTIHGNKKKKKRKNHGNRKYLWGNINVPGKTRKIQIYTSHYQPSPFPAVGRAASHVILSCIQHTNYVPLPAHYGAGRTRRLPARGTHQHHSPISCLSSVFQSGHYKSGKHGHELTPTQGRTPNIIALPVTPRAAKS